MQRSEALASEATAQSTPTAAADDEGVKSTPAAKQSTLHEARDTLISVIKAREEMLDRPDQMLADQAGDRE